MTTCRNCASPATIANGLCRICETAVLVSMIQPRVAMRRRQKAAANATARHEKRVADRLVEHFI